MTQTEIAPPRGTTGRADLLRALAVAPRERLVLDVNSNSWFGYIQLTEPKPSAPEVETCNITLPIQITATGAPHTLPLRMPFVHAIVERQPRQPSKRDARTLTAEAQAKPIDEDSAKGSSDRRMVGYEDLVPQARLMPALRRLLGSSRGGSLDLDRLIYCLATRKLPHHLPRRRLQHWHPELVVLFDFSPRLWPYREDMHRLAEWLLRQCGRSSVSLRIVNYGPFGSWSDWLTHQNLQITAEPPTQHWVMPAASTSVLIVSDLGLLHGTRSAVNKAWKDFIATLVKAQLRPVALAPLGASQLDASLTQALPILRWSPDARTRPEGAHGAGQPKPEGLDDLLAMVAATRRVDPPLLRAMRRLNPRTPLDAGLEGALWCHADVDAGTSASIRIEAQERHLRHFESMLPYLQVRLEAVRYMHHAHLRAVLNHEETWLWRTHATGAIGDVSFSLEAHQRMATAEAFMARLVATLQQPDSLRTAGVWWSVAQGIVQRADAAMGMQYSGPLISLVAVLARTAGGLVHIPDWVDPAILGSLLGDGPDPVHCWLVQDAASGCLLLQARPAVTGQSPLGEGLMLDAGGARVRIGEGTGAYCRWLSVADLPAALTSLSDPTPVHLDTSREAISMAGIRRPRGLPAWGCHGTGIVLGMSLSDAELHTVPMPDLFEEIPPVKLETEAKVVRQGKAQLQFGVDRRFNVRVDLTLATAYGSVIQRLRWIEPGIFQMGSPNDELERSNGEGPRHAVRLTQGFWLADSACTQALWQEIMGTNPSGFKGVAERPVENVSWVEVQQFLRKLELLLPGCEARLPTEAEWEYACRAGSDTTFSFGAQITTEQVNYEGNSPYAGNRKGLYRRETVPVKSLPPNAWGLYEMHGNVWEWCADNLRTYDIHPQQDPQGSFPEDGGGHRAVRGGSWINDAGRARSAYRSGFLPNGAGVHLGFRLCLRFIEPHQMTARPDGRPATLTARWPERTTISSIHQRAVGRDRA